MTRDQCEQAIRDHLLIIRDIICSYGTPEFLSLCITRNDGMDIISFFNQFWDHDSDGLGIDYWEDFGSGEE